MSDFIAENSQVAAHLKDITDTHTKILEVESTGSQKEAGVLAEATAKEVSGELGNTSLKHKQDRWDPGYPEIVECLPLAWIRFLSMDNHPCMGGDEMLKQTHSEEDLANMKEKLSDMDKEKRGESELRDAFLKEKIRIWRRQTLGKSEGQGSSYKGWSLRNF